MNRARHRRWECLVLAAVAVALASCGKAPCDAPYTCPRSEVDAGTVLVNCQSPADTSPECVGTCHAWLSEHCADVMFLY